MTSFSRFPAITIPQKFEYYEGNLLSMSSGIVRSMSKSIDLRLTLAHNLRYFMSRKESLYKNANALGVAAKIAPNTVRHLLGTIPRTLGKKKPVGYPTLDKLEAIAKVLNCDVWHLLHPDIEKFIREQKFYEAVLANFHKMTEEAPVEAKERV